MTGRRLPVAALARDTDTMRLLRLRTQEIFDFESSRGGVGFRARSAKCAGIDRELFLIALVPLPESRSLSRSVVISSRVRLFPQLGRLSEGS